MATPPQPAIRAGRLSLALLFFAPALLLAGGGPFNTLVVINTNSASSVELGEYYATARGIPAHHLCRLGIATNLVSVISNDFRTLLLDPITTHIATSGLAGQIDFLVLCQDFPTRVRNVEGVSASLFYGFQNAPAYNEDGIGCNLPEYTSNAYYRAERAFRSADDWNSTNGFVAFHLIASNLPTAKLVVDRGAAAQSSFPSAAIYLYMLGDQYRGIREQLFANTQFSFTSLPGLPAPCVFPPLYELLNGKTNVVGYHDGFPSFSSCPWVRTNNIWVPGAYADHMTSYGGAIKNFTNATTHSTVLDWMEIGATASYGTVAEPCAYLEKFPDPIMGFYYARGFTIGEAYAMAVAAPYQGLFAGDPLAAPFAAPPSVSVMSHAPYQIVTGTVPVQVSAAARSNGVPPASLDLFLDGHFHTNLATLGPTPGNILSIVVAGVTSSVVVATNHSLFDAVAALAVAVNADSNQIVSANATGDRIELVYKQFDHNGDNAPVSAFVVQGEATVLTLGVGLAATNLAPSIYPARKTFQLLSQTANGVPTNTANAGDTLTCIITLTNFVAVTNIIVAAPDERITNLLERLRSVILTNETLMATNGVRYDRLARSAPNVVDLGAFFARTPGPDGAFIHVDYTVDPFHPNSGLMTNVNFSAFMQDHPDDLWPRASILFHVRPADGILSATASVDTVVLADGIHTLDFIARDGSAVAAQSRLTLPLVVCNESPQLAVLGTNGAAIANGESPSLAKGSDFGPVEWGQTRTNLFSIHNNGSTALTIVNWTTNGSGAGAFQIAGIPATVEAGGVSNFTVVFAPASGTLYEASLSFESDAVLPQTNLLFAGTGAAKDQTIIFPPIADQFITNELVLSAAADSGLKVSFAVASGPAQIADGTNLSFTGTGTVALVASQAGDANWNPAPEVTNTFSVYGLYTLTVASEHGAPDPPVGIHTNLLGTVLTNSISVPEPEGGTQFVATGWILAGHEPTGGPGTNFVMTVTNDATLTWLWASNFWLDTAAGPNGSVDVDDSWQAAGITTQVTATADLYYHFTNWTGSVSGSRNPLEILMDSPQSIQANFAANLAASNTPEWWLAQHGWTSDFDAVATNDDEPDGYPTWQEYIADTDPKNSNSYPRVDFVLTGGADPVVTWPASSGRLYQIHLADDLVEGLWTTQQLSLGAGEWTDTNPPPATNRYYRIAPLLP